MIELSQKTMNMINEYTRVQKELADFEKEIKKQKERAEALREGQEKEFTFERANELNTLTLSIDQAESALKNKKVANRNVLEGRVLTSAVNKDVAEGLKKDDELLSLEMKVKECQQEIKDATKQYYELHGFKRDKAKVEIEKLSDINLYVATKELYKLTPQPIATEG